MILDLKGEFFVWTI